MQIYEHMDNIYDVVTKRTLNLDTDQILNLVYVYYDE